MIRNLRHLENDAPDGPLLLEKALALGELDVAIGEEKLSSPPQFRQSPSWHRNTPKPMPEAYPSYAPASYSQAAGAYEHR